MDLSGLLDEPDGHPDFRSSVGRLWFSLRLAPHEEACEGSAPAPACVPGEAYGWVPDSVIVEIDNG